MININKSKDLKINFAFLNKLISKRFISFKYFICLFIITQGIFAYGLFKNKNLAITVYKYISSVDRKDFKYYLKDIKNSIYGREKLERIDISINFNHLTRLDCLRQREINCGGNGWAKGILKTGKEIYPIKLKAKGDRDIHRKKFKGMSYKIDIRGDKRFKGMEEFSIQSPIIRNYSHEALAANIMRLNNIISPRNYYVRLFLNGEYIGIRHIEESYSRELIEASKKRYGPIFKKNEPNGGVFGSQRYDLTSPNYWLNTNKKIADEGITLLEITQQNPNLIKDYFDLSLWAKYFAITDVLNIYHGSVGKSVNLYLNPVTGLIEPAFYDGHHLAGDFSNFLLIDFINKNEIECEWICYEKEWYNAFFLNSDKSIDKEFYTKYYKELERLVSNKYTEGIIQKQLNKLSPIRGHFYRELNRFDGIFFAGPLPHIARISKFKNKIATIKRFINKAKTSKPFISVDKKLEIVSMLNQSSKIPQIINLECNEKELKPILLAQGNPVTFDLKDINGCNINNTFFAIDESSNKIPITSLTTGSIEIGTLLLGREYNLTKLSPKESKLKFRFENNKLIVDKDLTISNKNIILPTNLDICLANKAKLLIFNSTIQNSSSNKSVSIKGCGNAPGTVIIQNSNIHFNNLKLENLAAPVKPLRTLYGGLNIIQSSISFNQINIKSSKSEDAINIINSNFIGSEINTQDIQSDSIDSDSSTIEIDFVKCKNVMNDCLDLSYSKASIGNIIASDVKDKAISAGEKSTLRINKSLVINSEIGIVSKDSSRVEIKSYKATSVKVPIASYIKKLELGNPSIKINQVSHDLLKESLISNDSEVYIKGKKINSNLTSSNIMDLMYGKTYGRKTIR
tara:strand:- start:1020 stop:3584 length:2565 start_codon:yes stop_codon:yes gene_type:complete